MTAAEASRRSRRPRREEAPCYMYDMCVYTYIYMYRERERKREIYI